MKKFPNKKYQIIYADPPWSFSDRIRSSKKINGKYQQYNPNTTIGKGKYKSVMSEKDIKNLPVALLSDNDCVLFLWTTDAHLPLAIEVMNYWELPYKTIGFVWNKKEKSGKQVCYYGKWTMKGTELCLLGAKGKANSLIQSHKIKQLVEATRDRTKHSVKPDEVRKRIVQLMGNLPRIELFAREHIQGWDVWGDEAPDKITEFRSNKYKKVSTLFE